LCITPDILHQACLMQSLTPRSELSRLARIIRFSFEYPRVLLLYSEVVCIAELETMNAS
jgi:hypothetical protein